MESQVILENGYYVACVTKAGLSVQNKRTGKGLMLPPTAKDYQHWVNTFMHPDNKSDFNYLAKSFASGASF